jgi:hypothetical protein
VARKGANRPIFEGETPPKKCTPNIGADIDAITGILLKRMQRAMRCSKLIHHKTRGMSKDLLDLHKHFRGTKSPDKNIDENRYLGFPT